MGPEKALPRLPVARPAGNFPAARGYSERNHQAWHGKTEAGRLPAPFTEGATPYAEGPVLDRELLGYHARAFHTTTCLP